MMRSTRRAAIVGLIALILVAVGARTVAFAAVKAAAGKYNVLLIVCDDLNNDLACYGHKAARSPRIDELAGRGIRFDRAYCQYPLCNPSRASLLSGRRPDTTRVYDLDTPPRSTLGDVVFLPQYFRQHGYHAAHVGKIFHTGDAFEDSASWDVEVRETGKHPPESEKLQSKRVHLPLKNNLEWDVLRTAEEDTADGVVATRARGMLADYAKSGQRFFLAVGFRRPHQPYAAPKKYFDLFPPTSMPIAAEPRDHLNAIPAAALTYPVGTPELSEKERQQIVAAYRACVAFVDAQVGRVLDAVESSGLWNNTIVVFTSDHGYHLGEHGGMWHKMSLFEQSARVPLIVAAPGVSPGQSCQRVIELVDLYPTLVDLCELPTVSGLEGQSLKPLLADPKSAWRDVARTQVRRGEIMGRSIRTPRWRYSEWDEGRAGRELYDHDVDPQELKNLAGDAHQAEVIRSLSAQLRLP